MDYLSAAERPVVVRHLEPDGGRSASVLLQDRRLTGARGGAAPDDERTAPVRLLQHPRRQRAAAPQNAAWRRRQKPA